MTGLKLSVIIPTYNRPGLICNAIQSILNQTYYNIEIIVVDGSDNDDTKAIASSISDTRLQYVKIANQSASHSRNIGMEMAKGDFVSFNDDDDVWHIDKAEKQLNHLASNKSSQIVYSLFSKKIGLNTRTTPDKTIERKKGDIYHELLLKNFIGLPTIIASRTCCDGVNFDEELSCLEDWDWIIRLAKKNNFEFVEESLVTVNNTPKSVNKSDYSVKANAYIRIYSKNFTDISKSPNIKAKHLLSIGNNLCLAGNIKEGRGYLKKSLEVDIKKPVTIASYLISFLGLKFYKSVFKLYEEFTYSKP